MTHDSLTQTGEAFFGVWGFRLIAEVCSEGNRQAGRQADSLAGTSCFCTLQGFGEELKALKA